jgi:DNA-binding transcriptional LysR family regulator
MDFHALSCFVEIAKELSFSKAARHLNITQPPLTRKIQRLESEWGVKLFIRDHRGVQLTDAGRLLLRAVDSVFAAADRLKAIASLAAEGKAGVVRIGIGVGLGGPMSQAIAEHSRKVPEIEIDIRDLVSSDQNFELRDGVIDAGFMRAPVDNAMESDELFEEHFQVLLSTANPLSRFRSLKLFQLADQPLLIHDRSASAGLYDTIMELFNRASISPKLLRFANWPFDETVSMQVALGKGVYIGSQSLMGTGTFTCHPVFANRVVVLPLEEPGANVHVCLAWRKQEKSKAVLRFLEVAKETMKSEMALKSRSRPHHPNRTRVDCVSRLRLHHAREHGSASLQSPR